MQLPIKKDAVNLLIVTINNELQLYNNSGFTY